MLFGHTKKKVYPYLYTCSICGQSYHSEFRKMGNDDIYHYECLKNYVNTHGRPPDDFEEVEPFSIESFGQRLSDTGW